MARKSPAHVRKEALQRVATIRAIIARLDFSCSGTLLERRKVCGKPSCRCAQDPAARHGPYYEWTRRHKRSLLHRVVSPEQAQMIREAIKNYRAILKLLRAWERETVRVIESLRRHNR
jgi:uncharacterized protein DUF6788